MATTKHAPGWYPTKDGGSRRWDGSRWTDDYRPPPPPDSKSAGWKRDTSTSERWWTGDAWSPARRADSGLIDVRKSLGQATIAVTVLGGGDSEAIAKLNAVLEGYPPCRIEQLQSYTSAVAAGTNLIAVVSW